MMDDYQKFRADYEQKNPSPQRKDFQTQDEYLEAKGFYNHVHGPRLRPPRGYQPPSESKES
jgi:hypothetical protein